MSNVTETDAEAIAKAIRILTEAGLRVEKTNHTKSVDNGVSFKLECFAPTRTPRLEPQLEAVRGAAINTPEFGMGGERIEDGDPDEC